MQTRAGDCNGQGGFSTRIGNEIGKKVLPIPNLIPCPVVLVIRANSLGVIAFALIYCSIGLSRNRSTTGVLVQMGEKQPKPMSGADILVQCLLNYGVEAVFAYPGGASMPIHQALTRFSKRLRSVMSRMLH